MRRCEASIFRNLVIKLVKFSDFGAPPHPCPNKGENCPPRYTDDDNIVI